MAVTKDVTRIILRRGSSEDFSNEMNDPGITKYEGEPRWNTTTKQLYIFDGTNNVRVPTANGNDEIDVDVAYDNTSSGLTATNVQDAIDELKALIDTLR
jgi:hypothetical protein